MKDFFRKNKLTILSAFWGLVIATVGVPFLLNVLFKIPAPIKIFEAEWEAADALSYYGEILSFLSTTALSALALWQNKRINDANEKHTILLEEMEREKSAPQFFVEKYAVAGRGCNLRLEIINVTDNIAQDISMSNFTLVDEDGNVYWEDKRTISVDYLGPLMKYPFELQTTGFSDNKDQIEFTISYSDIHNTKSEKRVVGYFSDSSTLCFSCCKIKQ